MAALRGFAAAVFGVDADCPFLATVEGELPPDGFVERFVGADATGAVVRGLASPPGELVGRSAGTGASLPELPPDFL